MAEFHEAASDSGHWFVRADSLSHRRVFTWDIWVKQSYR